MKKKMLKPMMTFLIASFTLAGCASSNDNQGATAMDATQASADADQKSLDVGVVAAVPVAAVPIASLSLENSVPVGDMFEDIDNTEQYDLLTLARKSPNLSTFVKLVELAGMENSFTRAGDLTLFAPTNEAFAKLPKEKLEMLANPANKASLMRVLQAHVLPSKVATTQFNNSQQIELTPDRHIPVSVSTAGTMVTVGGATIVKGDVEASNGIIQVVDNVIVPSEDAVQDQFGIY